MTAPQVSSKLDVSTLKKYLADRGFPNEFKYQEVGIELAGPARCREALGMKPDPMDTRLGIIYHYPALPGEPPYATVRWFGRYVGAFGQVADLKLQCPAGRPVQAYRSPLCGLTDGGDVWLCESVLKAIVLSTTGRYSVGGNGVRSYYVKGEFVAGFPTDAIERCGKVVIAFDNDTRTNPDVAAARRALTQGLRDRWPDLKIVWAELPDPPGGGKWGIDDYIASGGDPAEIPLEDASATDTQRLIDEINNDFCLCMSPPCIIRKSTGTTYSRGDWCGLVVANKKVWQGEKVVEGSKVWLASEERSMVERMEYTPGSERILEGEFYNLWRDDGVKATRDSVEPFLKVYENAIPDSGIRQLLFQSFAWILQNRGTKLEKTFVFVGRQVGTGKSLLAQTMARILGRSNFASIGLEDFQSDFNSVFAAKEMVLIDDLHRMGQKEISKLRRYTTDSHIVVNTKNLRQYSVRNMAVFIITTNEYAALAMDDVERRNLVVNFDPIVHYDGDSSWWLDYVRWLDEEGGAAALRGWLESMDLSGFNPNFMPPMTETKKKMIGAARSAEDGFVLDLWENTDVALGGCKRSVYTTAELWFLFTGEVGQPGDLVRFGRALANKFDYANGGKLGRYFSSGKTTKVWKIRNPKDKWDLDQCRDDIKQWPIVNGSAS